MPSIAQEWMYSSHRWGLGLLVSMLTACGPDLSPPVALEAQDALASAEQELDGECTADWAANPCTVADSAACGTGSAGVDTYNSPTPRRIIAANV